MYLPSSDITYEIKVLHKFFKNNFIKRNKYAFKSIFFVNFLLTNKLYYIKGTNNEVISINQNKILNVGNKKIN